MQRSIPPLGDLDAAMLGDDARVVRTPVGPGPHARKPWLALLLGILVPSAAFAYVGRLGTFVVLLVGVFGLFVVLGRTGLLQTLPGVWGMSALALAFSIACAVLPWWFARTARPYRLRAYNRWYVYPLLVLVLHAPVLLLMVQREAWLGYASFRVPSSNMAPTIDAGDLIVADTRASTLASVRAGDVVVVASEQDSSELFLRRIVAVGGQHVVVGDDGVRVDGVLQPRTHQQGNDVLDPHWMQFADVQLEPDELYLMGDNRGNSLDSRTTGPAWRADVHAKATAIWWSNDRARLGAIPTP